MARSDRALLMALLIFFASSFLALSLTDPVDLSALQGFYESLNDPPQLIGWNRTGGDPCGDQPWTGVTCSGQSVISINIKGLGLGGLLGPQLSTLLSLKELDVSYNNIGGEIPHGLPPNATSINLAVNNFNYSIPYPFYSLKSLIHLNVSHNSLSGPIGNVYTDMQRLEQLDLSFNNLTGDLPSSFGSLANLHALYLQNNSLTGSVAFLANLPLTTLYLQNNHFSGYVPQQFEFISSLRIDGNQFQAGFQIPPPSMNESKESPSSSTDKNTSHVPKPNPSHDPKQSPFIQSHYNQKRRLRVGALVGIICSVLFAALLSAVAVIQILKACTGNLDESLHALPITAPKVSTVNLDRYTWDSLPLMASTRLSAVHGVKPARISKRKSCSQKTKNLANAKLFSVSELLEATNSYSNDNVIGKGSNGCVYKAEFPDGQILAVKKINMVALAIYEEDQFLDVVQNLTRLRHPNINTLVGYSVDHGEHILVYDYAKNGSLDVVLSASTDDTHKVLSWKTRVRIALGVAHALEYLHCICSPPMAHGNMKASNILLDDELMPHVSDCGITALRHLINTNLKASEAPIDINGYAAPELGHPGADMTKCDIYSYGIILLELLTRQRAFDSSRKEEQLLAKWASSRLHDSSSLEGMVDPEIKCTMRSNILSQFADIILLCIQPEPEFRSPVTVIAESLISLVQKMAHPRHRSSNRKRSSVDASEVNASEISFKSTLAYLDSPTSD